MHEESLLKTKCRTKNPKLDEFTRDFGDSVIAANFVHISITTEQSIARKSFNTKEETLLTGVRAIQHIVGNGKQRFAYRFSSTTEELPLDALVVENLIFNFLL